MTREDVARRLQLLIAGLEAEVRLAATRDQHIRASRNLADARALAADLVREDAA